MAARPRGRPAGLPRALRGDRPGRVPGGGGGGRQGAGGGALRALPRPVPHSRLVVGAGRAVKAGALLLQHDAPSRLVERAQLVETAGYDHLWLADERFFREVYASLTL